MGDTYLAFAEQALRYFNRPHEQVCRMPLDGPAAWRGPDLARRGDWIVRLTDAQVAELEGALAAARGRPLASIGRTDFPLPTLGPVVRGWARELATGRGLLLVRGLPVARWGEADAAVVFWGLGQHLGRPGAQNSRGELLGHVVDTGEDAADPFVRKYRTAAAIAYHCDLADVVGLLCLSTARRGGASRVVSSVTVFNEFLRRRPDLVDRLFEPFALDTRGDAGEGQLAWIPVPPCRFAGGVLRTFFHSDYFRSVVRHADAPPLTARDREVLDLYEEIAASPELCLDMELEPGDMQWLSNHTVLHARAAYEDDAAAGARRHLLRLWLSLEPGCGADENPG